jgi:hypothetical protein
MNSLYYKTFCIAGLPDVYEVIIKSEIFKLWKES